MLKNVKPVLDAYMKHVDTSWNSAIDYVDEITPANSDAKILINMYKKAYQTTDYIESSDPDYGLCFRIRRFVIMELHTMILEGKI